jgi:hypothetical protein
MDFREARAKFFKVVCAASPALQGQDITGFIRVSVKGAFGLEIGWHHDHIVPINGMMWFFILHIKNIFIERGHNNVRESNTVQNLS